MKKSLFALSIAAVLTIAGPAMAKPHENPMREMMHKLDLSKEQRKDFKMLMKQGKQDHQVYKADMLALDIQLKAVIQSQDWDATSAADILKQRQIIETKLALARAVNRNYMWNNLTNEQQQKLVETFDEQTDEWSQRNPMRRFGPLDLTEQQTQQIKQIFTQQKNTNAQSRETLKSYRQQEAALIRSSDFASDQWQAAHDAQQDARLSMALAHAEARHQVWNLLTPEQQQKLQQMTEKMRKRHDKKRDAI